MVESGSGKSSENGIYVVKVDPMVFANGLDMGYQERSYFSMQTQDLGPEQLKGYGYHHLNWGRLYEGACLEGKTDILNSKYHLYIQVERLDK